MGTKKVVTFYWCCDRKGCKAKGSGEVFPVDWRYMTIFQRTGPEPVPADAKVLLCPTCADLFKNELSIPKPKDVEKMVVA